MLSDDGQFAGFFDPIIHDSRVSYTSQMHKPIQTKIQGQNSRQMIRFRHVSSWNLFFRCSTTVVPPP